MHTETDKNESIGEERRKEERFYLQSPMIASLEGKKGKLVDASNGGLAICFEGSMDFSDGAHILDLELHGTHYSLEMGAVFIKDISHQISEVTGPRNLHPNTRCGFSLGKLNLHQRRKLDYLLWDCTDAYS